MIKIKIKTFLLGYMDTPPDIFPNPHVFCFDVGMENCAYTNCAKDSFFKCSWCRKVICVEHLFKDTENQYEYHYCQNYIA
jgi:hypothetical protein